jgi:hypothetical protein
MRIESRTTTPMNGQSTSLASSRMHGTFRRFASRTHRSMTTWPNVLPVFSSVTGGYCDATAAARMRVSTIVIGDSSVEM